ncbi:MAG: hypothetical protein H6606_10145 [Flavobacteriales bacterium]|nr:hypothetical protein [Flavobacteriales bacterium]
MNNWNDLNPDSKIWIYTCNRFLNLDEVSNISNRLAAFCAEWNAHGASLNSGYELFAECVIVLAVDESAASASGCSIDSSVQVIREIDAAFQLDLFNRLRVLSNEDGEIHFTPQSEVRTKIREGKWNADTPILHVTARDLGTWKHARFIPIGQSWLAKFVVLEGV